MGESKVIERLKAEYAYRLSQDPDFIEAAEACIADVVEKAFSVNESDDIIRQWGLLRDLEQAKLIHEDPPPNRKQRRAAQAAARRARMRELAERHRETLKELAQ